jgi:hypothetical protein
MDLFNLGGNEEVEETSDDDMDLFNLGGNKEVEEELDDDDAFISKNSDRNIDEDIVETNYKLYQMIREKIKITECVNFIES